MSTNNFSQASYCVERIIATVVRGSYILIEIIRSIMKSSGKDTVKPPKNQRLTLISPT